jgi:phosphoglycerate dehydrogenase-like enzyme
VIRVLADWTVTDSERAVLAGWPAGIEVVAGGAALSEPERMAVAAEVDVLAGQMDVVTVPLLLAASRLKLVQLAGHGVDALLREPIPALMRERGIRLARANSAAIPIAEFVLMSMVALARRVPEAHRKLWTAGEWITERGPELHSSTVCVLGLGSIGEAVLNRARAIGMHAGAVTRRPERHDGSGLEFLLGFEELAAALGQADHVVLALPRTRDTTGLLDAAMFAAMRPGSYLINVSRAGLVDEDALVAALASGHLAGAALDCWWCEEQGRRYGYPADHPLHLFNVQMTPHFSGSTVQTRSRALRAMGENIGRFHTGLPLLNEVSLDNLAAMAG